MSQAIAPKERTAVDVGDTVTLHFMHGNDGGTRQESYEITEGENVLEEGKLHKDSPWGYLLIGAFLGSEIEFPAPEGNIARGTVIGIDPA